MHLPADHHENQQVNAPGRRHRAQHRPQGRRGLRRRSSSPPTATRSRRPSCCCSTATASTPRSATSSRPAATIKGGVSTYADGATGNLMTDQLYGSLPWLRSIDSDHSWRSDGRPRFCATEDAGCPSGGAQPRPEEHDARQRHVPALGVVPAAPDVRDALPRLGERHRAVPGARRRAQRRSERPGRARSARCCWPARRSPQRRHDLRRRQPPVHGQGGRRRRSPTAPSPRSTATPRRAAIPGAWKDIAANGTFSIPANAGDGTYDGAAAHGRPVPHVRPGRRAASRARRDPHGRARHDAAADHDHQAAPEGVTFDSDDFSAIEYTVTDAASGVDAATVKALFDGAAATHGPGAGHVPARPGRAHGEGRGGRQPRQRDRHDAHVRAARHVEPAC